MVVASDCPSVRQEAEIFDLTEKMPDDLPQYLFVIMLPSLYCIVENNLIRRGRFSLLHEKQ